MRDRGCLNAFKIINFNAGRIVLLIAGIAMPNISLFSPNGNCTREVTWYKVLGVDGVGQRNNKLRQVQASDPGAPPIPGVSAGVIFFSDMTSVSTASQRHAKGELKHRPGCNL